MFTLKTNSPDADFVHLFAQAAGFAFKYESNYETILGLIAQKKPNTGDFNVYLAVPGTSQYTDYGANTLIVIKNTLSATS